MLPNPGRDLNPKQLEVLALRIDQAHRKGEADLIMSRWYDVRLLHPVQATYLYAEHYREACKRWCQHVFDLEAASDTRAFSPDDIFMSRDMTSMWLARRSADSMGVPYAFVMDYAHTHFLNRRFATFPRPNQLYGEAFELDMQDAWKAHLSEGVRWSREPVFKASAWRGLQIQREHSDFVVKQMKERQPAPRFRLIARMLKEDVLSDAVARREFGDTEVDQAFKYLPSLGLSHH